VPISTLCNAAAPVFTIYFPFFLLFFGIFIKSSNNTTLSAINPMAVIGIRNTNSIEEHHHLSDKICVSG
jgi:hypothetical protein